MALPQDQKFRVLVCQQGARHRYAIPRMLEESGHLAALYTDSSAFSRIGCMAAQFIKFGFQSPSILALACRIPNGIPRRKIFSSDRILFSGLTCGIISADLSYIYQKWGILDAQVVYSMYGEACDFLEWGKRLGCKIVVDVFIHPKNNLIVVEEEAQWLPGKQHQNKQLEREDAHSRRVFELADLLLCPSSWVADGVREFAPELSGKVRIVPYGSSLNVNDSIDESTQPGRVLFVGREPLRKGLHYLAEATQLVRQQGLQIDVRAAGVEPEDIEWMEHREEIRCLGRVPMDRMRQEYEQADLLVLPSLSEGQAGVILEAMACGCPVIATRESGVDFEPGCGITIPARNTDALAETIVEVVSDRKKRNELARGALRQSAMFTMEAWRQRLVQVVAEVAAG